MQQFDIVVVGASFSGSSFIRNLPKERDYRILLVDAKQEIGSTVESTGLITSHTRELFSRFFDVDRYITNRITTISVVTTDFEDHFFSHSPDPWIFQTDTRNLVRALNSDFGPNVVVWPGTLYLNSLVADPRTGQRTIILKKDGKNIEVKTRFLIGADGGGSVVAATNGLDRNKKFLFGIEHLYLGKVHLGEHPTETIYHFWFGDFSLGYGGWLSSTFVDGKMAFRIGLAKNLSENSDAHRLLQKFTDILEQKGIITLASDDVKDDRAEFVYGSKIPIGGILKNIYAPGVLLIGDAAGFCGAFAADGIKGSVISAIEGAQLVDRYLSSVDPDHALFDSFHRNMNKHKGVIDYYRKQMLYRIIWENMKSNRTFRAMYDVIKREKEDFLQQFCDSKDKGKSLIWVVLKVHNLPLLIRYSWYFFIDFFKK